MSPLTLLPAAISEMFAQVSTTGQLTLADRYGLMAAILSDAVAEEERRAVDRLLYAVRQGRVNVVDELSNVL